LGPWTGRRHRALRRRWRWGDGGCEVRSLEGLVRARARGCQPGRTVQFGLGVALGEVTARRCSMAVLPEEGDEMPTPDIVCARVDIYEARASVLPWARLVEGEGHL